MNIESDNLSPAILNFRAMAAKHGTGFTNFPAG